MMYYVILYMTIYTNLYPEQKYTYHAYYYYFHQHICGSSISFVVFYFYYDLGPPPTRDGTIVCRTAAG